MEYYLRWGLHVSILKTEYVNLGSDIQNMKLENNIEIKGSRSFMCLGFIFMNPGKCNEEVLNTNKQARRAMKALNSVLWSKYISVNIKKWVFYVLIESVSSYGWEMWVPDYKLQKKLLSAEMDVWRRAAWTTRLLKVRNEAIREKMQVTKRILERLEKNMLKWCGQVCMEDNRWHNQITSWSLGGR